MDLVRCNGGMADAGRSGPLCNGLIKLACNQSEGAVWAVGEVTAWAEMRTIAM